MLGLTVLQLRMPEPREGGRRAQVGEADWVPDRETGLVRSALPAEARDSKGSGGRAPAVVGPAVRGKGRLFGAAELTGPSPPTSGPA